MCVCDKNHFEGLEKLDTNDTSINTEHGQCTLAWLHKRNTTNIVLELKLIAQIFTKEEIEHGVQMTLNLNGKMV